MVNQHLMVCWKGTNLKPAQGKLRLSIRSIVNLQPWSGSMSCQLLVFLCLLALIQVSKLSFWFYPFSSIQLSLFKERWTAAQLTDLIMLDAKGQYDVLMVMKSQPLYVVHKHVIFQFLCAHVSAFIQSCLSAGCVLPSVNLKIMLSVDLYADDATVINEASLSSIHWSKQ